MTYAPKNFTVWTEIPVTDLQKACDFYNAVTDAGLVVEEMAPLPFPIAVFKSADPRSGVSCNLYLGTPAGAGRGPTIHLAAPGRAEAKMERVTQAGGTVVSPVIDIPEGRFFKAHDPDGNPVAFFEVA